MLRVGPESLFELRELRYAGGASVPGSARRPGRGEERGELLRIFRDGSPRIRAEARGRVAGSQGAGYAEEAAGRLTCGILCRPDPAQLPGLAWLVCPAADFLS